MKNSSIYTQVAAIIARVREEGDNALFYYARKFDNVDINKRNILVSQSEIDVAGKHLKANVRQAINVAARNVERFHRAELKHITRSWFLKEKGKVTGRVVTPVETAGIYVPGGRFSYPSTVLMAAIPARVAGVRNIIMVTPPARITPAVLYAARVSGVNAVYRIGGPAAIAALAYGTKSIPRVDMIVGPGNAFVNEAKRQVFGAAGIDSLAGPSEVAIIADATAPVAYVLADLMAQAEHDPLAKAYFFTDTQALFNEIKAALPAAIKPQVCMTLCSLSDAVVRVNRIAPEHLELMVKNAPAVARKIKNAGAIFAGSATPTAAGDYGAGPSHILPTAGTARFSSVLSVETFMKRTSYIQYGKNDIMRDAGWLETLAGAEGLECHRLSVEVRRK